MTYVEHLESGMKKWKLRAERDRRVLNAADADYDKLALAAIRLLDKLPSDTQDWKQEYDELYNLTVEYREYDIT